MSLVFIDTETFCVTPINSGTHVYAEKVEILLFAYAIEDGPVKVWDKTINPSMPESLLLALEDPANTIVIHNSAFDRTVIRHALKLDIPVRRVHDLMVRALAHGLPGSLDKLCDIFRVPRDLAKDKEGKKLMMMFCKPRPKNEKLRRRTRETHPEAWAGFVQYAGRDIEAMRYLYGKMPNWNYKGKELNLWFLDQKINDRGYKVDRQLASAAIASIDEVQNVLARRAQDITTGEVGSANQRDKMLLFILKEYGLTLPNLQASTIERFIYDETLPDLLRELLAIRIQSSTTSTGKYKKLIAATSSDGYLRGTLQFCGASRTGRWSGRTFQPQNLPSRGLPKGDVIDAAIVDIKAGKIAKSPEPMKLISAAIRGCIVAPDGKKLIVSDLSNIEGRIAAWLAGEDWKLEAFRLYDIGAGHDLYNLAYAKSFHITPEEVSKDQRQIGKVQELALGYAGGVNAFLTFALAYDIDLDAMANEAWDKIPGYIWSQATAAWGWATDKKRTLGLTQKTYVVCDAFKRLWREANPAISAYWKQLEEAAVMAIQNPGIEIPCKKLKFIRNGVWLRMILPSGRSVCYPQATLGPRNQISYKGVNQWTRQWSEIHTHGGKLFENACQAVARDVMAENMPNIENCGYEIILTCHDEVITQTPDNDKFSVGELSTLLADELPWYRGLPLAAGGFESKRYRKG